jgi:hypothetical protein
MLRRAGFFREFYPDHPSLPWLRDHVSTRRVRSETKIVDYLRAGHLLVGIMEWGVDHFDGTPFDGSSGCSSLLTDGQWVWRQDLAHYVERYHVELETNFVASLVAADFRMPDLSVHQLTELTAAEKAASGVDWWAVPR